MSRKPKKANQRLTSASKGKVKATDAAEKLAGGKATNESSNAGAGGAIRAERGKRAKAGKPAGNGQNTKVKKQAEGKHGIEGRYDESKEIAEASKHAKPSMVTEESKPSAKRKDEHLRSMVNMRSEDKRESHIVAQAGDAAHIDTLTNKKQGEANRHHNKSFQLLQRACENSSNMRGKLRQQQARIALELPDALPSALLLRALQKNSEPYRALSTERIALIEHEPSQVSLQIAGLTAAQMQTLIEELDELIGQFTGRN